MANGSPINDILQMRQQGLSNNQIIQNLQRQGFTNTQIFDAMNQADTKMAVEGVQPGMSVFKKPPHSNPPDVTPPGARPPPSTSPPSRPPSTQARPSQPPMQQAPMQQQNMQGVRDIFEDDQVKMEELVEAIIEEKWVDLVKDVEKIIEWKNRIENRLADMEAQINSLKDNYSDLQKAVLGKVNDYDKHILEIGSNIKAMEKVFSKVLPTFTENVNELSRISQRFQEVDK